MSIRTFERAVIDWLEDGSDRTPRPSIDAVLLAIKTTPQERGLRLPRRLTLMSTSMRAAVGIALVAVLAVGALAFNALRPGIGGPSPGPSPTSVAASPSAGPTASAPAPSVTWTGTVSSALFGYDARYPAGWRVVLGTAQGTAADLGPGEHMAPPRFWDHFTPTAPNVVSTGILATSTVVPSGMTRDEWIAAYQAPQVAAEGRECIPEPLTWETITVDGHQGAIYAGCGLIPESMTFVGDRVFIFYYVNMSTTSAAGGGANRAFLETFLASVSLHPERAAAPSLQPS